MQERRTKKGTKYSFLSLQCTTNQEFWCPPRSSFTCTNARVGVGERTSRNKAIKVPFSPSSSSFFLHYASSSHAYGKGEEEEGEMEEVLVFPIWRDSPSSSSSSSSEMRPCFPSFPNSLCCSLLCVSPRPSTPPPLPYMANGLRLFLLLSPQRRV